MSSGLACEGVFPNGHPPSPDIPSIITVETLVLIIMADFAGKSLNDDDKDSLGASGCKDEYKRWNALRSRYFQPSDPQ